MKTFNKVFLLPILCGPVFATVSIVSFTPSIPSPQLIGATITWTATATDSGGGPLTFRFSIQPPGGSLAVIKDYNVGKLSGGTWTSVPFVWVPTGVEGTYTIKVVIKDFTSNLTQSKTVSYTINPLVTQGTAVAVKTANPLVALISVPSCPAGSTKRVLFQEQSGSAPATGTNWVPCHPPTTITFEIAGMLPSTAYNLTPQTNTGGTIKSGTPLPFTTGALPTNVPFPKFPVKTAGPASDPNPVILHSLFEGATNYPIATDLSGNIIWYNYPNDVTHKEILTRPLPGGGMIVLEDDYAWNPKISQHQFLRQIDLAGNIVRETNTGVVQQELKAKGSPAGGACTTSPVVGSACIGAFHHDAIQTLPNGYTAVLVDEEKIFPAGTQGDISGLPVDIVGDMILVLDTNWQVVWYWDVFDPPQSGTGGTGNGYPNLPVTRTAIMGETCGASTLGCSPMLLLFPNVIAPYAHDWLHGNSLYYWPAPQDGNTTGGDIIWSARHQDWVLKIDYKDGAGTGNILWRMGSNGDFNFDNIYNDPWHWFSHQHDVGIENKGAGPMTVFDNGDNRTTKLGTSCKPYDCNSRGMALTVDESKMMVTPIVSIDLGSYSNAMGSAQLLSNGNYFFENPIVPVMLSTTDGYSLEIGPAPPVPQMGAADVLLNLAGPAHYRAFQMPNLYSPPTT